MYIYEFEEEIFKTDETSQNSLNLTKAEQETLQDFMYGKNIVVKPADKRIAIVNWNKQEYLKECQLQLDNKIVDKEGKETLLLNMLRKKEIDKDYSVICWLKVPNLSSFIFYQRYIRKWLM